MWWWWALALATPTVLAWAWPAAAAWTRAWMTLGALMLVGHILWMLVLGRLDDLDPLRRRLRLLLSGGCGVYVLAVLVGKAVGGYEEDPVLASHLAALGQIALKLLWLWLTLGVAAPLAQMQAPTAVVPATPTDANTSAPARLTAAVAEVRSATSQAQLIRHGQLIVEVMTASKLYRKPRLSVADLAHQLALPEHRVRTVINGHLGFRNFTSFVNHFRLREVARRLRDPTQAHLPILSIALDEGYGSTGPFNKAFRDAFGITPSEYRAGREPQSDAGGPALRP